VRNKCPSKQSLSTVETKGSLSLPDRIILNSDVSLIFKIDQLAFRFIPFNCSFKVVKM